MAIADFKAKYGPLLREAGLKITVERLSILAALDKSQMPLSAKDLKSTIKGVNVDQATIYRTMESLAGNNIVRLVNFRHGHNHYELEVKGHHHHIICQRCGKVADIPPGDTVKMEKRALKASGFSKIASHSLEFFGLCNKCAKK